MIVLRQKGFDMIKMVNLCNHCDVNKKLCSIHFFFCDGFDLFLKVGLNKSNILQLRDVFKPCQCNTFLNMQTHVLKASLLT